MGKKFVLCLLAAALLLCVLVLPRSAQAAGEEDLTFKLSGKGYIVSGCDTAATGELVIPATYQGLPVTGIGTEAFSKCFRLTGITIPDSVTSIGKAAFFGCSGLKSVNIPSSVKTIGESAFNMCSSLESVVIPDSITRIEGYTFSSCSGLKSVVIPDTVTVIGKYAFSDCKSLTNVVIPGSVTDIGEYAFARCIAMTSVRIPASVTQIGVWAFNWCTFQVDKGNPSFSSDSRGVLFNKTKTVLIQARGAAGEEYEIPDGVIEIGDWAFHGCSQLKSLVVPSSITKLGDYAFNKCSNLENVYYTGTEQQWRALMADPGVENSPLFRGKVHYDYVTNRDMLAVFTDRTDLRLPVGDRIILRAGVLDENGAYTDASGITFQISDGSRADVEENGFDGDCFYIRLRGVNPGTVTVTFSDDKTGHTVAVPITVFGNSQLAYTLGNVPEISSYGETANFANFNGLYIDSFTHKMNSDQSAHVTFDVYNTNYSYGVVLVYTQDGELYNAVLIDKMDKNNTSIKEVYWDGTICAVQAIVNDNYRGGFVSKQTHVEVDIPQNGYIKITCDSEDSGILALVNYTHAFFSTLSLIDKVENFDKAEVYFAEELIGSLVKPKDMIQAAAAQQFRKDGHKFFTNIIKDGAKELTITAETVGDFSDTLSQQLLEFDGLKLITESLAASGIDFGEDVLLETMGRFGAALKAVFAIGKVENLVLNYHDIVYTTGGGTITIQNQGGGIRASNRILLESEVNFDPAVALQTYAVELSEEYLEFVRQADQETYDILTQSICRTYNISLLKGEEMVQHSGHVTVYIPIPYDLRAMALGGNVKVYRIEEDGSLTDMDAVVEDGCMRFVTDHFSLYTLVGKSIPGDLDGNGTVNQEDAVYLLLHTMFGEEAYPLKTAADLDGSGAVDQADVVYLLLYTMFGETFYPLNN